MQEPNRPAIPPFEFKLYGHFTSRITKIQTQAYHPSQQVLLLGSSDGQLLVVGGDVQMEVSLSRNYRIDSIQVDQDQPIIYLLCTPSSMNNPFILLYDLVRKQVIHQIAFQSNQTIHSIRYFKSYLLIHFSEQNLQSNQHGHLAHYVKYMNALPSPSSTTSTTTLGSTLGSTTLGSEVNFKFIQPITLMHPMAMHSPLPFEISSIEIHPMYDHVVSVGYTNGDVLVYYIYHVHNTSNNTVTTNINSVMIQSPNMKVTCLNWHSPNLLVVGYDNGTFVIYEINHQALTFTKY